MKVSYFIGGQMFRSSFYHHKIFKFTMVCIIIYFNAVNSSFAQSCGRLVFPETQVGQTTFATATLWCVGDYPKIGEGVPKISGNDNYKVLNHNCSGTYYKGHCCRVDLSFTPLTAGKQIAYLSQSEIIIHPDTGAFVSGSSRCVNIESISTENEFIIEAKQFDENNQELDWGLQRINPSRIACGRVANDSFVRRRLEVNCLKKNSNGEKVPAVGCKIKMSLLQGQFNGGHDHEELENRWGSLSINKDTYTEVPTTGLTVTFTAPDAAGETVISMDSKDPNGNVFSENLRTTFRIKNEADFTQINIVGLETDITSHPGDGDYLTVSAHQSLNDVVSNYRRSIEAILGARYVHQLETEGASLSWGGLFDYKKDWSAPHCGHINGNDIDLSMSVFNVYNPAERIRMKTILANSLRDEGFSFPVEVESPNDPSANHWHTKNND